MKVALHRIKHRSPAGPCTGKNRAAVEGFGDGALATGSAASNHRESWDSNAKTQITVRR